MGVILSQRRVHTVESEAMLGEGICWPIKYFRILVFVFVSLFVFVFVFIQVSICITMICHGCEMATTQKAWLCCQHSMLGEDICWPTNIGICICFYIHICICILVWICIITMICYGYDLVTTQREDTAESEAMQYFHMYWYFYLFLFLYLYLYTSRLVFASLWSAIICYDPVTTQGEDTAESKAM